MSLPRQNAAGMRYQAILTRSKRRDKVKARHADEVGSGLSGWDEFESKGLLR
jgi:hypothetical protein